MAAHRVVAAVAQRFLHPTAGGARPGDPQSGGADRHRSTFQGKQVDPSHGDIPAQEIERHIPPPGKRANDLQMFRLDQGDGPLARLGSTVSGQPLELDPRGRYLAHGRTPRRPETDPNDPAFPAMPGHQICDCGAGIHLRLSLKRVFLWRSLNQCAEIRQR